MRHEFSRVPSEPQRMNWGDSGGGGWMSQTELKAAFDLRIRGTRGSRASPVPGHLFSSPPINKGDQNLSWDSTKKSFSKGLVVLVLHHVLWDARRNLTPLESLHCSGRP